MANPDTRPLAVVTGASSGIGLLFTSSIAARMPGPYEPTYAASKGVG